MSTTRREFLTNSLRLVSAGVIGSSVLGRKVFAGETLKKTREAKKDQLHGAETGKPELRNRMRAYEIQFNSVNSKSYPKPITALVIEPQKINSKTGAILFTHGWSGNRFQHRDKMEYVVNEFNVVAISVEYRQSGYDFNPMTGLGSYRPYDASFYQVFDVLNGLREILKRIPVLNRNRLFHYGASQGGHICLLSSIFAPNTFASIYASCPIVAFESKFQQWSARTFDDYELSVRNVLEHTQSILCPVFLESGTADRTVPHARNAVALEKRLRKLGKTHTIKYYERGGHNLQPTITRLEAFKIMASDFLTLQNNGKTDDFAAGRSVDLVCANRTLRIDWSQPSDRISLFSWR